MKVINDNLPLNDANLGKVGNTEKRQPERAGLKEVERDSAHNSQEVQQRIVMTQSHISKAQAILNGLRQVVTWLDEGKRQSDYKHLLSDLIDKTQSRKVRVLEPYREQLSQILGQGDVRRLRVLIAGLNEELQRALPELGKNQTAQQNILAADRDVEKEELDKLLETVVADLKSAGKLNVNLTRDRVIDLLG